MKLLSYTSINFKSAKLVKVDLSINEVNTFIGINDAGKSTLLQALKLFFDEKPTIAFETDTSKKSVLSNSPLSPEDFQSYFQELGILGLPDYANDLVGIHCRFEIEGDFTDVQLEELSPHLQCVLHSLSDGDVIDIFRCFSIDGTKNDYYIHSVDFMDENDEPSALWNQNKPVVVAAQKRFNIPDSEVENRNSAGQLKNVERIIAIHKCAELQRQWSKYDFKKDRILFPEVRYLDWNISTEELNQLTTDIISPIMKKLIEPMKTQVADGVSKINDEANSELSMLYAKYAAYLPPSISGISANVKVNLQPSITELFVEKLTADKKIHIEEQGDGIRRQIGLGLIRAIAQESVDKEDVKKKYIWCFDEPETHLYPQAQRELAESLSTLSKSHFQVLVSTHSTLFVDRSKINDIKQVALENYYTVLESTTSTEEVFESLGVRNSDFLFYNKFIAVEGPTEYYLLDHFHKLIYGTNLADDGVQAINLQGKDKSTVYKDILDSIFTDFKKTDDLTIFLFDKDTSRSGENIILVGEKADFEDSVSNEIWIRAIKAHCSVDITSDELEHYRDQIDIADKNKKLWHFLSSHIAKDPSHKEYLPSKGENLALLLKEHIVSAEDIPACFIAAFEATKAE